AAELVLRDMAAQAHPAVAAIERATLRAAAPAGRMRRRVQRAGLGAVTAQAVFFAVTRRALLQVAARLAGVQVRPALRRARPARRMEHARRILRAELRRRARAEPRALVACHAERF